MLRPSVRAAAKLEPNICSALAREEALAADGHDRCIATGLRERANVEFEPVDFESPTRLRDGQPITIDRESWLIRKIDLESAGLTYDGFVWVVAPEAMQ